MKHTRIFSGLIAALAILGASAYADNAEAQEIQLTGPLAGAPAVRHERLHRDGRFEITPQIGATLLNDYRTFFMAGATLMYNFTDYFSFGLWGTFSFASPQTDLTTQIDTVADRNSRTAANVNHTSPTPTTFGYANFADQTSKIDYSFAPQVQFAPFRGKIALFQKLFVDTDLYIHAGLAFTGVEERGDCGATGQTSCTDPASFALKSGLEVGPTGGLGLSFYTNGIIGFRIEYRALPFFKYTSAGFDSAGAGPGGKFPNLQTTGTAVVDSQDQSFRFNQIISLGVVIAFPTAPKVSE